MKKIILSLIAILGFALVVAIAARSSEANTNTSSAEPVPTPSPRKIVRNPAGICTGCCDPCYDDHPNGIRNRSTTRSRTTKAKRTNSRIKPKPKGILPYMEQNNRSKAKPK
ncbi:MAG: hypothetical protein QM785_10845 [Pyrinomonadaceae bacterium]